MFHQTFTCLNFFVFYYGILGVVVITVSYNFMYSELAKHILINTNDYLKPLLGHVSNLNFLHPNQNRTDDGVLLW